MTTSSKFDPTDEPSSPGRGQNSPEQEGKLSLQDRFRGALLGTLMGDALGMPVEGWPATAIRTRFGRLRDMLEARLGAGTFTDDTQMTAALAQALIRSPDPLNPDPSLIADHFAQAFDSERGYGGNTRKILGAIQAGTPWEEAVDRFRLPGGSFANGSAMRVAPVALAAFPDPGAAVRLADLQCSVTGHDHPEARFGARLQAVGVLLSLAGQQPGGVPEGEDASGRRASMMDDARLQSHGPPTPSRILEGAAQDWEGEIPQGYWDRLTWIEGHLGEEVEAAASVLGTGVRAVESVPAALWAFLTTPDDAEEAIVTAVAMGGDTDTIGAMAGALAGAWKGASHLPARWLKVVEGGPQGRDGLVQSADVLFRIQGP